MALKYKVVVSGTPIENKDMQEVISERLAKKNIPIDEKTLLAVTDAVMHHIYKLNMEWKHDNSKDDDEVCESATDKIKAETKDLFSQELG